MPNISQVSSFLFLFFFGKIKSPDYTQIRLRPPKTPSPPVSPFPPPLGWHVLRGCTRVSPKSLQVGGELWDSSSQFLTGPAWWQCHHSSPAPRWPPYPTELLRDYTNVNCRVLTKLHLPALGRPQASSDTIGRKLFYPSCCQALGGTAWGVHKSVVPTGSCALSGLQSLPLAGNLGRILFCQLPHLLSLHRDCWEAAFLLANLQQISGLPSSLYANGPPVACWGIFPSFPPSLFLPSSPCHLTDTFWGNLHAFIWGDTMINKTDVASLHLVRETDEAITKQLLWWDPR